MDPADRRGLAIVFLVVVIDLVGFGILLPLLPLYAKRLQTDAWTIGLLTSSFSVMQFLFAPLWGRLSDRIGRRPVLLVGLAGSTAFYALFAYGTHLGSLPLLFAARIGQGIAGATISTAQAFVADVTPPEKRTGGMALIGAAFGIGFTFGPLLGGITLAWSSVGPGDPIPTLPGILASALSATAFVVGWFRLPESLAGGRPAAQRVGRFDANAWRVAFEVPTVPALVFAFFAATLAFSQFESTLSLVLDVWFGLPPSQTYAVYFYVGITLVLAQGILVRRLSKTVADKRLAMIGVALMMGSIAAGMPALAYRSLPWMLALFPALVTGFAFMTPSLQSMVSKRTPADRQGAVLGVLQSASAMARIVGQLVGPWLLLEVNLFAPYLVTVGLMAMVLVLLTLLKEPAAATTTSTSFTGGEGA